MAIKGTATIELTNADGSKEIIKHDNMITNAVDDLCVSTRGEIATILKMVSLGDSYAQAMFGGLLLFDAQLNSDPDDYTIPTSKITGYASQTAYAGLDLARGSFNESEGGVQEDGSYKFVWDFSTSQGNGTIQSLALCPNVMGKIGASDTIVSGETDVGYFVAEPVAPFNSYGKMLSDSGETSGISNWCFNIAAIVDDVAYALDNYNLNYNSSYSSRFILNNGGILKLYKFKLGATTINLADKVARARYLGSVDIQLPSALISVLTSSLMCTVATNYDYENKKLIVFPCSFKTDVPVNGTLPYIDIDFNDNMKITEYTFTNTTAGTMLSASGYRGNVGDSPGAYAFYVTKDYILVLSGNKGDERMYVVSRADNTKVTKVTITGEDLKSTITSKYAGIMPFFINKNTFVFNIGVSENGYTKYILDLTTGVCKKFNGVNLFSPVLNFGNDIVQIRTGAYLKYYTVINPFVITTKNNLDSPVVKTASQTMKITYTLSEVAEG